jgi:hypothetical protein
MLVRPLRRVLRESTCAPSSASHAANHRGNNAIHPDPNNVDAAHICDSYAASLASISISYAQVRKYPPVATQDDTRSLPTEPLTGVKAERASDRLLGYGPQTAQGAKPMLDVILLAVGLGFFALSIAYAFGCDRL